VGAGDVSALALGQTNVATFERRLFSLQQIQNGIYRCPADKLGLNNVSGGLECGSYSLNGMMGDNAGNTT